MTHRIIIISFCLLGYITAGWSIVKFADDEIRQDFESILDQFELVNSLYNHLSSSKLTYIIRYGELDKLSEGSFFTDGETLYITLKSGGKYSLQAKFVHEATHAIQFETGRIAFYKNKNGEWKSDNIDLWDEAEAFLMMLAVVKKTFSLSINLKWYSNFLYELNEKLEMDGLEGLVKGLAKYYPMLSEEQKNNCILGEGLRKSSKYIYMPYKGKSDFLNTYLASQQ
jgi:hypothetical protein